MLPPSQGGPLTVYLRTHFNFTAADTVAGLISSNWVDDGAVYYLNGMELVRLRIGSGAVGFASLAENMNPEGQTNVLVFPADSLFDGDNVLAVEVHQSGSGSSDVVFGMTLDAGLAVPNKPALSGTEKLANGDFQFNLNGVIGRCYALDRSANLKDWTELLIFTNFSGQTLLLDNASPGQHAHFYRCRLVP